MITFKQFLTEKRVSFNGLGQQYVIREPFFFKWVDNTDLTVYDATTKILAVREDICDSIEDDRDVLDEYNLKDNPKFQVMQIAQPAFTPYYDLIVIYPRFNWWFINHDNIESVIKEPFFIYELSHIYNSKTSIKSDFTRTYTYKTMYIDFLLYNHYMAQTGSIPQKKIKTLEYLKQLGLKKTSYYVNPEYRLWQPGFDNILFKLKLMYLPRTELTKRDNIKGALMDL